MTMDVSKSASSLSVKIGRFWFQNRSISPVPLFLLYFFVAPDFSPQTEHYLLFGGTLLFGELLRMWGVGCVGSATRTRADYVPKLVISGPYCYMRNPLYIGNILMYTSAGLLMGHMWLSAAMLVYSCVQYHFIVRFEESILRTSFGKDYEQYFRSVPRWLPCGKKCERNNSEPFDFTRAFKSEKSTFFSITAFALLFIAKKYLT